MLEALSSKAPVLVRDIPVYSGWLKDSVNCYKADTQEQFQEKAREILSGRLPDITGAGHECVEERSLRRIGEKLMDIQKTVVSK